MLDEVDQQIVAHLVQDARASFREIGEAVGLSAPAVKRRVDRLEDAGVILGYRAVLDPRHTGGSIEAFVELHCRNRTNPAEILDAVECLPEVVAAYTVTGEADALLRLRTADMQALERVLEQVHAHPNTERTKSVVVLSRLLERQT